MDPSTQLFEKAALRGEVKELLRSWKELKKEQKRQRRQLRRELKRQRRQEKRERRQVKREMKRAAREMKREMKREWRHGPPHPHHPPHHHPHPPPPHPPHHPHGPLGMPPMPPIPPMPPMPGARGVDPTQQPRSAPPTTDWANNFPFNFWNRTPGAWPSDDKKDSGIEEGVESTADHAASQAKYRAAWEMEAKVVEKEAELIKLHERIAEELSAAESIQGPSKMEAEAMAVEKELEELAKQMEKLRTEADEEYARELAEEEERRVRG
ncbi:hypothetical protein VTI74DRAFT_1002 [Chaetomium olivicolor]